MTVNCLPKLHTVSFLPSTFCICFNNQTNRILKYRGGEHNITRRNYFVGQSVLWVELQSSLLQKRLPLSKELVSLNYTQALLRSSHAYSGITEMHIAEVLC